MSDGRITRMSILLSGVLTAMQSQIAVRGCYGECWSRSAGEVRSPSSPWSFTSLVLHATRYLVLHSLLSVRRNGNPKEVFLIAGGLLDGRHARRLDMRHSCDSWSRSH